MRFKALKYLSDCAEDVGVFKIMLKIVIQRETCLVGKYIGEFGRFQALPDEEKLGFEYIHRSLSSSCFVRIIGKNRMQRPANL